MAGAVVLCATVLDGAAHASSAIFGATDRTPVAIAIDAAGNIYTANQDGPNTVTKITAAGVSTVNWASTGATPNAIATDAAGNVYIANQGSHTVTKITAAGVPTINWASAGAGSGPTGIAIDAAGNVYTANQLTRNVTKITPGGTATMLGTTGFASPMAIVLATDGTMYTANRDPGGVTKITPDGTSTPFYTATSGNARAITIDSAGNVYYANRDLDIVTKITLDGTSAQLGPTGDSPSGIAIDAAGNVYTANQDSHDVTKITPGGATTTLTLAGGTVPIGITIDADGSLYVVNAGTKNVTKIMSSADPAPPAAPAAPSAVAGVGVATVTVVANTPSAAFGTPSSYTVTAVQDSSKLCTVAFGQSTCTIGGLAVGTAYTFTARAHLATWQTAASAPSTAVTPTSSVPDAPTALVATPSDASASLAFTAGYDNGSAITNYEYRLGDGSWTALDPPTTTSPVTIANLTNSTTYSIRLRAINGSGDGKGAPSAAVSVTPVAPLLPPASPTAPRPATTTAPRTPSTTFRLLPTAASTLRLQTTLVVSAPGVATQRGTFSTSSGTRGARRPTACTGRRKITKAGRYTISCTLTAAARSARRHGPIRITLVTTFTPTGGTARAVRRTVTLKQTGVIATTSSAVTG